MPAWRNKETGLWLVQDSTMTHTKTQTTFSETDDLQKASILLLPDFHIRRSKKYEPVKVDIYRKVTISK